MVNRPCFDDFAYFSGMNNIIIIERTHKYAYFVKMSNFQHYFLTCYNVYQLDDANVFGHMLHDENIPFTTQIYRCRKVITGLVIG